jgi:hypothetical protein
MLAQHKSFLRRVPALAPCSVRTPAPKAARQFEYFIAIPFNRTVIQLPQRWRIRDARILAM